MLPMELLQNVLLKTVTMAYNRLLLGEQLKETFKTSVTVSGAILQSSSETVRGDIDKVAIGTTSDIVQMKKIRLENTEELIEEDIKPVQYHVKTLQQLAETAAFLDLRQQMYRTEQPAVVENKNQPSAKWRKRQAIQDSVQLITSVSRLWIKEVFSREHQVRSLRRQFQSKIAYTFFVVFL
jgi:hypothetical protein